MNPNQCYFFHLKEWHESDCSKIIEFPETFFFKAIEYLDGRLLNHLYFPVEWDLHDCGDCLTFLLQTVCFLNKLDDWSMEHNSSETQVVGGAARLPRGATQLHTGCWCWGEPGTESHRKTDWPALSPPSPSAAGGLWFAFGNIIHTCESYCTP